MSIHCQEACGRVQVAVGRRDAHPRERRARIEPVAPAVVAAPGVAVCEVPGLAAGGRRIGVEHAEPDLVGHPRAAAREQQLVLGGLLEVPVLVAGRRRVDEERARLGRAVFDRDDVRARARRVVRADRPRRMAVLPDHLVGVAVLHVQVHRAAPVADHRIEPVQQLAGNRVGVDVDRGDALAQARRPLGRQLRDQIRLRAGRDREGGADEHEPAEHDHHRDRSEAADAGDQAPHETVRVTVAGRLVRCRASVTVNWRVSGPV